MSGRECSPPCVRRLRRHGRRLQAGSASLLRLELDTATDKSDEVKTYPAERAKYENVAPPRSG